MNDDAVASVVVVDSKIGQGGKREPGRGSRTGTGSETLEEAAVMDEIPSKLFFSGLDGVERAKVLRLNPTIRQKVLVLEDGDHFQPLIKVRFVRGLRCVLMDTR